MTRKDDKGDQPSGGETTWANTGATRYGNETSMSSATYSSTSAIVPAGRTSFIEGPLSYPSNTTVSLQCRRLT